ncbi:MAG: hypothetical protein K9J21_07190 [Bacteroidales bacterium]|nr:hypothetical protein [Bacteroidales bacterium]
MTLNRSEIIEIILRQFPVIPSGLHERLMEETNIVILHEAQKAGLTVELRNGCFILNQKLS